METAPSPAGGAAWVRPAVVGLIVVGGLLGIAASSAPTDIGWWDAVLRCGFAALIVWLFTEVSPRFAILASGVLLAFAGWSLALPIALMAVGAAVIARWLPPSERDLGLVVSGILASQAALRLPSWGPTGTTALVVAAVVGGLLWAAWPFAGVRKTRNWVPVTPLFVLALGIGVVVFVIASGLLRTRGKVDEGSLQASLAVDAIEDGRFDQAVANLERSGRALDGAAATLGQWWMRPANYIPVLSQNTRAARTASVQGSKMVEAALMTIETVEPDKIVNGGSFDLDRLQLLARETSELARKSRRSVVQFRGSESPWLLPSTSRGISRFERQLRRINQAEPDIVSSIDVAVRLLGKQRPQRVLVMLANPSDSLDLGGSMGGYAIIELDDGAMEIIEVADADELNQLSRDIGRALDAPGRYPMSLQRYRPAMFPENLTGVADLAVAAEAVDDIFPEFAGQPIDAVMYVDPFAIEALVGLVGEVEIQPADLRLTGENTADYILADQYERFRRADVRSTNLKRIITEATTRIIDDGEGLAPGQILRRFRPLIEEGRLQIVTTDRATNRRLAKFGVYRPFPEPDGTDLVAVLVANAAPTKLDTYLERQLQYIAEFNPDTGALQATATVLISNAAPAGLPQYVLGSPGWEGLEPGSGRNLISVVTPHHLAGVSVDGEEVPISSTLELGFWRHTVALDTAPGETHTIIYELRGSLDPTTDYSVRLFNQPLVSPEDVSVVLRAPEGFRVDGGDDGGAVRFRLDLEKATTLRWTIR